MPLVSVVIPTFNRPEYLRIALGSVLAQSHRELEVLVLDDAGPEANAAVAAGFADARIRYIRNPCNHGIFANNLNGFRLATGKYIADLNDDDQWEPDFVAKLVAILEAEPGVAVAFSDHFVMDETGKINSAISDANSRHWKRDRLRPGLQTDWHRTALLDQSIPVVMAALLRREAIDWDLFPPAVGSAYDYWLGYLCWKSGRNAYYIPERLTRYRAHAGQQTGKGRVANLQGRIACLEHFLADPQLSSIHGELYERLCASHRTLGRALLAAGEVQQARRSFSAGWRSASALDCCAYALSFAPAPIRRIALACRRSAG